VPPATVLVTFAGRRDRMALLQRYATEALRRGLIDEWHVWNFARDPADAAWLRQEFPVPRQTADDRAWRPVGEVPLQGDGEIALRFQLRAGHDAHIALRGAAGPCFEIVLGAWGNTGAALRRWGPGGWPDHAGTVPQPLVAEPAPALLAARAWRHIVVQIERRDGIFALSVTVNGREVLRHADVAAPEGPLRWAVMTGYGAEAEWRFSGVPERGAWLFEPTRPRGGKPWNACYRHYAERAAEYADTVFVKCDDDIVFLDLDRLADFIAHRQANRAPFLLSANVVNNGVCAHLQQRHGAVPEALMALEMPPHGFEGSLWQSGSKAAALHRHFLAEPLSFARPALEWLPQQTRLSINCVAWLGADLPQFDCDLREDEHMLTVTLPAWLGRPNQVHMPFVVSHLSFFSQDAAMDIPGLLAGYEALARERLAA